KERECAEALADDVDAADFLHVETHHLAEIGASSLTNDEMAVADADLDSDKDGVPDKDDECPDEAGNQDNNGCPVEEADADGDGIVDADDECPEQPGLRANNGCRPEKKKAVVKDEKIEIREKVNFEYDKAVIKKESYGVLDAVGLILRTNPEIQTVEIQGHTDDAGTADYNKKLSEQRAKAVKQYLIDNADIDPERLKAKGYGASMPLVPNNSDKNRAKNRRVEFKILEK
ncbi:MAG: OmpA family protein, partial [Bradymonadaceae bacterium]